MNHLANGKFHSSVLPNGLNQWRLRAHSAQKFSGSLSARRRSSWYSARLFTDARALNSGGGGNFRTSLKTDSICDDSFEGMGVHPQSRLGIAARIRLGEK